MKYGTPVMAQGPAIAKVLVVDDNAANRALAKAALDDDDVPVVLAATGEEALAAFERAAPDCVLLDIQMPGMDGVSVCERIRSLPGGDRVAIVFVTAQRDVETFDRAVRAGGDDFITKPFRPSDLLMRLQLHKEQLSAFLVHDLKNPVNTIGLLVQRILRSSTADDRSRDAAARILDETRGLLRMITNLLDIGKADEGRLAPQRAALDARALIDEVIAEQRTCATVADLELVACVEPAQLFADHDLMHRVLANLIDNAIRHAPSGSAILVGARPLAGAVELHVSDAGAGIPEPLRDRVFERFMTGGDAATRTNRGLGLAFCKAAVEAHGGQIWVEDAEPGARFCVRIDHVA
jgi:two-component system sensor histidine kinase/response regulator